jgi:hypothetical protein
MHLRLPKKLNTRVGVFSALFLPGVAGLALMGAGVAYGGINTNVSVSGVKVDIAAAKIEATGFSNYGAPLNRAGDVGKAVRINFSKMELTDTCVAAPVNIPMLPDFTLIAKIPGERAFGGTDASMYIESFNGNIVMGPAMVGANAGTADGENGEFSIQSDEITITDAKVVAYAIAADTMTMKNASIGLEGGIVSCS